jgi:hypothetical protein
MWKEPQIESRRRAHDAKAGRLPPAAADGDRGWRGPRRLSPRRCQSGRSAAALRAAAPAGTRLQDTVARQHSDRCQPASCNRADAKNVIVWLRISEQDLEGQIIRPIAPEQASMISQTWQPGLNGQEDGGWDWGALVLDYPDGQGWQQFAIVAAGLYQGAAIVKEAAEMRSPANTGTVGSYLEYMATAPWNRLDERRRRIDTRFDRATPIGQLLMLGAIKVSLGLGHEGRLGWHSKIGAVPWYEKTFPGVWCGGPDATENGLPYYEIDAPVAAAFVRDIEELVVGD